MKRLAWLALFTLILVLGTGGWLLGSSDGLRFIAGQLEARGWLEAEAVAGKVFGRLELKRASLHVPGLDVALDRLVLDWRPAALLRGRLHVSELAGSGIRLAIQPRGPAEPFGRYTGLALPLEVQVDRLQVEDLALRQGEEETLIVRSLTAGGELAEGRLRLKHLALDTPWATLDAVGHWGLGPADAGDLALRWKATLAGLKAPLEGEGQLSGTLRQISFEQRLTQPMTARLTGAMEPLTAGLPWHATLDADEVVFNALLEGLPELGAWAVHLAAAGDRQGAQVSQLELHQGERRLHGEGRLDWAGMPEKPLGSAGGSGAPAANGGDIGPGAGLLPFVGLRGEARLGWQNLAWPLAGPAALESSRGTLELRGSPSDYRVAGEAQLAAPGQPAATVALRGEGDLAHLTFDELTARALDGELTGRGTLHWAPGLRWQAELTARDLHPELLLPAWPGRLSASARSEGALRDGRPAARLEVERLHGELRGHPVEARLRGQVDGARLTLEHLDLRSGRSRVEARGALGEALDLALSLDSPDLAELLPGAMGALRGSVQVAGSPRAPRVQGVFEGQRLGWQDWRIATLTLRAGGGLEPGAPLALVLAAGKLSRSGAAWLESARLEVDGNPAAHDLRLELSQGREGAELRLAGSGRWDGAKEHLRLDEGCASRTPLGEWLTLSAVELVADTRNIELPRWCWGQDQARLCMAGRWAAGQQGTARVDLAGFDLARTAPWLTRQRLRLSGRLAGEAVLEAPLAGALTLAARLEAERAVLYVPGSRRGEWLDVPLEVARMEARLGGGDSRLAAVLRRDASNRLEASLALPGHRMEDGWPPGQRLDGVVELHYREPLMLAALIPALREPRGVLAGRLQLAGTLGQPSLFGGAQVLDASVVLPDLGIRVEEGALVIHAGPGPYLSLQGGARLGSGRLRLDGRGDLAGLPDWRAEFGLQGDNLTALRLPEASVQASPDLKIALRPGESRVAGRVEVPEALFDLGSDAPAAARISPDVRVVGEEAAERPHALHAQIELLLGERVRVRGKGFTGRIAGRLMVIDRPGLPGPIGQGALTIVDGRYKAYGQDLAIEQGRLLFADTPLDDPALEIRAVRRGILDGTIAGARITGRASRPQLTLFSEPAMEQAEVLSYLVTGRPLKQGSGGDAALMVQAARAAGFAGGDLLAGQIGNAFGLEEAAIESDVGTEELSLVLGRYLTPRLYLRYVQGLEEGLQTFVLRYELTRHVHVQVQSGVKAGVDVFYSFER
ncbi:MAG: translocation/assembly module TamB domain-containing protein [Pseudomonadota bacterium]